MKCLHGTVVTILNICPFEMAFPAKEKKNWVYLRYA